MRSLIVATAGVFLTLSAVQAAERRMFIIPNDADGYGIDRCLANGERCGHAAATSYCQSHAYAQAASYHKVDRGDITGSIPGVESCTAGRCPALVAIVCTK